MGDIYDVNKYTDEELYNILDLVNPSDRELEAKIFYMINKYKNMQNESGNKLAIFFNNIYARFFEIVEEDETDHTASPILEKLNNMDSSGNNGQSLVTVQNYIPGIINPLLNQTITRIISIDSQYRDSKQTTSATNFTFNLSETLHNVLAIRLNSVQIPKTWYTISKSYGANFFYLKGNSPGINDGLHDYKIEVSIGNYTAISLITTLNTSISTVKSTYTDACFGSTGFLYGENTCKATFTMDYTKTFSESNFAISFPTFSYPIDASNSKQYNSIPQILGFDTSFIPINYITSNYIDSSNHPYDMSNNLNTELFYLNATNNYFKIVNYNGYDSSRNIISSKYVSADASYNRVMELSYNTITIKSSLLDGSHNRGEILSDFNKQLQSSTDLSGAFIDIVNITDASLAGYTSAIKKKYYYKFTIPLNPFRNQIVKNIKTAVIFPQDSKIWIGSQSCFQFDSSVNEISTVKSNSITNISNYTIGNNVYFTFKCDASGYVDNAYNNTTSNNIRINIAPNTYSLTNYIAEINASINRADVSYNNFFSGNTGLNVTNFAINSITDNYLRMRFYIQKKFTTNMYYFDCSSDCYFNYLKFDLSSNLSTIVGNLAPAPTYYNLQDGPLFRIYPRTTLNLGNRNADPFVVYLDCSKVYHSIGSSASKYSNQQYIGLVANELQTILEWSIKNWIDPVLQSTPLKNSSVVCSYDPSSNSYGSYYILRTTLDLSINTALTYENYSVYFTDNAANSWNNYLYLNASYSLKDMTANYDNRYDIFYVTTTESTKIYGNLVTLYDNSNNYFYLQPIMSGVTDSTNANRIKITIDASANGTKYTLGDIVNKVQLQFDLNLPGSTITNNSGRTYIRINHAKTYNTSDYRIVFYDPFSFIRCFVGASSVKNTSWDTTIGWILGFRERIEYPLGSKYIEYDTNDNTITYYVGTRSLYTYNASNIATIDGDTTVSVNLYNYFMIVLNDYVQNHLNDGLVGIAPRETSVKSSYYANRGTYTCDPVTGEKVFVGTTVNNNQNTANQIYAENQKLLSRQADIKSKSYSSGPFVQDVFAIVPLNTGNIPNGSVYVETGGGLQKQERVYFGPVNLSRMNIQLVTDRGDTVDLNGSDWSCTLQCDQLYQNKNV